MKNKLQYTLITSMLLGIGVTSCQDDWDAHYDQTADTEYGTASLYEVISAQPELSDFCQVLKATKAFANSKQTNVTYDVLLGTDQFFTVWAPVNGTFNRDSLINLCQTSEGDSLVEMHFVKNHVARYGHSLNGKESDVMMLNGKTMLMDAASFENVAIEKNNIAARNGVLHTIKNPISYYYNIYEALVALPEYHHIGNFLRSYQIDELDETQSLAMGIVDGKTVYIDSVFKSKNDLLTNDYDYINNEDSTFWMIVPNKALWDSLYAEAESYYNYAYIDKADSVHNRWSHYALMQDLVFNPNVQTSINDSIVSTTWRRGQKNIFHTYYKPFEEGGLFTTEWARVQQCSNGIIYEIDKWPYDKEFTFFKPINVEAESNEVTYDSKKNKIEIGWSPADTVSNGGYIVVLPNTQTDKYYVEYKLPNVLSGVYDVCIVFLPRNVDPTLPFSDSDGVAGKRNRRASKFTAELYYTGTDGKPTSVDSKTRYTYDPTNPAYYVKGGNNDKEIPFLFECNVNPDKYNTRAFTNDPLKVDTIKLCTMHFPTCNYDQNEITNRLRITNAIGSSETNTYWGNWFIDRILLLPHKDEVDK